MNNIIIDGIYLFVYLSILFYFLIPDIDTDTINKNKIYIFIIISLFYLFTQILTSLKKHKPINFSVILDNCFKYGLFGILALLMYYDLKNTDLFQNYSEMLLSDDINQYKIFIISIFITFIISIIATIENILL